MRLRVYLWISFLVWTAAGCSKTDLWTEPTDQQGVHDVEVTFDVGANGVNRTLPYANLDDMAGVTFVPDGASLPQGEPPRKVLSSNNWQQVNDIRIYVFRRDETGTFTYYKPSTTGENKLDYLSVDDFARKFDLSPYILWWGGSDDRNETHRYVGRMKLESGAYRFLALARDDKGTSDMRLLSDPNVATSQWGSQEWREGITSLDEASLSCSDSTVTATTELFSGSTTEPITVDGSVKHFSCSIMLERAVAGVLLYVENIPATLEAYDPDEEMSVGIIPDKQRFPVVSVAVVHGKVLSNKVRVADRGATAGDLDVSEYNSMLNPPSPIRTLLKIDIPEQATVLNNLYVNTSPENSRHPNSLLGGSFVMPQAANDRPTTSDESYDKSLYLVLYGRSTTSSKEFALTWIPIRLTSGNGDDPLYYPIRANHFYSIGKRNFSGDGSELPIENDKPIDLRQGTTADIVIQLDPFWNEYYGGELGESTPGIGLDPEWGEHPAGELQK